MMNMIRTSLMLLVAAFVLAGCYKQPQEAAIPEMQVNFVPQQGDFLMLDGTRAPLQTVVDGLVGADYVVVGEGHTGVCDHKVQQMLLQGLSGDGRSMSLGLEMVAVDMQPVLEDFGKGQIRPEDMEEELQWRERWGYPFGLFRGHFELAERLSIPVAGLNVPPDVVRKLSREGEDALSADERMTMPAEVILPGEEQRAMLMDALKMHGNRGAEGKKGQEQMKVSEKRIERFMFIQSVWESKMAEEAVALKRRFGWPVMVVAGGGHVENGWGIPERIRRLDPDAVVMTVVPWRGGEYDPKAGDYSFYCPSSYESRLGATLTDGMEGVFVESVRRGSRADKAGFRPGMVLVEAQGIPVKALFDIHRAGKKAHDEDKPLVFKVRLGCDEYTIDVGKLGSRRKEAMQ